MDKGTNANTRLKTQDATTTRHNTARKRNTTTNTHTRNDTRKRTKHATDRNARKPEQNDTPPRKLKKQSTLPGNKETTPSLWEQRGYITKIQHRTNTPRKRRKNEKWKCRIAECRSEGMTPGSLENTSPECANHTPSR